MKSSATRTHQLRERGSGGSSCAEGGEKMKLHDANAAAGGTRAAGGLRRSKSVWADREDRHTYDEKDIANFRPWSSHVADDARRRDRCGWRLLKRMVCDGINT